MSDAKDAVKRDDRKRRRRSFLRRVRRWAAASAHNAAEVLRLGRLGPAYGAPYEVVERDAMVRLRRYDASGASPRSAPLVLVPPLMLTAEIYDVAPDLSAVAALGARGIDPWVVDFGAPEVEEGGMRRTLDDHVRAVARAVERVRAIAGRDVHLAGYSQGGMFAYQAAAYRRSEGIASVITFGSPVDIHRSLPSVRREAMALLVRALRPVVSGPLQRIDGLPGILTSTGFKLLTPRKEIEQLVDFVRKLHDRQALERRERRRRFLGGEGFVAWPGPALRAFLEEFVVHNRMLSGGFVIDGRTVSLADIACPVLCFVGTRDEIARPATVRAIARAAPLAKVHEIAMRAGHFGLVVGSKAMNETWPAVAEWVRWREGAGAPPRALAPAGGRTVWDDDVAVDEEAPLELDVDFGIARDLVAGAAGSAWRRLGEVVADAADAVRGLRFQLPRLAELERIDRETAVSPGRTLARRAAEIPDRTFFLWKGRAFSYREADVRVNRVVRGLVACGVRPGQRVGVLMHGRPSFLSMVTALNRLGAVAVVIPPGTRGASLERVLAAAAVEALATDPEHAEAGRAAFAGDVLVLGGGGEARVLVPGVTDMEAIDPARVTLPSWYRPDPGRAKDLALVLAQPGSEEGEGPRLAPITHHRWALSALGAAAACTLTSDDTVYCCLPLHHPTGILVSVGSALAGGARLALAHGDAVAAPRASGASRAASAGSAASAALDPDAFWRDVRRYGATVAFYAGEMMRALVAEPPRAHERHHPLRLLAGSGMRADLWRELGRRFGVSVLEFYASMTQNVVLANASGEKVGALGRPLPGSTELAVVRCDLATGELARGPGGHLVRCAAGEPGLVLGRLDPEAAADALIGRGTRARIERHAFAPGDAWFVSGDVLKRDRDGDYWFVDRLASFLRTEGGPVSARRVEDALYAVPGVTVAAAYGLSREAAGADGGASRDVVVATVTARGRLDPGAVTEALAALAPHERPRVIRHVREMPMTSGFQPAKRALLGARNPAIETIAVLELDEAKRVFAERTTRAPSGRGDGNRDEARQSPPMAPVK